MTSDSRYERASEVTDALLDVEGAGLAYVWVVATVGELYGAVSADRQTARCMRGGDCFIVDTLTRAGTQFYTPQRPTIRRRR